MDWFPRMRAMSLAVDDTEQEANDLRTLQKQLESTNNLVTTLSTQLTELREQVSLFSLFYLLGKSIDKLILLFNLISPFINL